MKTYCVWSATFIFHLVINYSMAMQSSSGKFSFVTEKVWQNRTMMQKVSQILDAMLDESSYNNKIRPGYNSNVPLNVAINLMVRTMGPILEEKMMYYMDIYFRQMWVDNRLDFTGANVTSEMKVSAATLNKLWKPDTFFLNGRGSVLHTITGPNKLLRVQPNGSILYSMRLTIKANCYINLRKYPMDNQSCPLLIGSYAYSPRDVNYVWDTSSDTIKLDNISLAQFQLMAHSISRSTIMFAREERIVLEVRFQITRMIGYYMLQIYVPLYLIVAISWVSFWINREATPARVTLGITTLLTTTTIAMTGREGIPKVPYSTALDVFLLMCFGFVFAALLEFAGVNYFTKSQKPEIVCSESDDEDNCSGSLLDGGGSCSRGGSGHGGGGALKNGYGRFNTPPSQKDTPCIFMFLQCLKGNPRRYMIGHPNSYLGNSVSQIDKFSRIGFPLVFLAVNMTYWGLLIYS